MTTAPHSHSPNGHRTSSDFDTTESLARETTEGTVYNVSGGDWDEIAAAAVKSDDERIIVNMGPQHPSTHGVLRLILEIDGETVTEARCGIGYLHTGIEKNLEFRTWTQGTTFVTRMDYLTPSSTRRPTAWPWRSCWGSPTRSPTGPPSSACC